MPYHRHMRDAGNLQWGRRAITRLVLGVLVSGCALSIALPSRDSGSSGPAASRVAPIISLPGMNSADGYRMSGGMRAVPVAKRLLREGDPAMLSLQVCGFSTVHTTCEFPGNDARPVPECLSAENPQCQDRTPPLGPEPTPARIRAVLTSSSQQLLVQRLDAGDEPLYSLHQLSTWTWSVTPHHPGDYFLVLTLALAGSSRDSVVVSVRKFIVWITVVGKKRDIVLSVLKATQVSAKWLAGIIGLLGIGTVVFERLIPPRKPAAPREQKRCARFPPPLADRWPQIAQLAVRRRNSVTLVRPARILRGDRR
jgi:hypothetical protein